jgi:hypothetical protein
MSSSPPRKKYTVFISSTKDDLAEQREQVASNILKAGHIPCGMEQFAAANDRGWNVITDTIDLCDYYVLIIAGRYGSIDDGGISWTEREYNYALDKGIPVLAFVREDSRIVKAQMETDPAKQEKLAAFVKRVRDSYLCPKWRDSEDLCTQVIHSLNQQIERDARGKRARPGWFRGDELPPRTDGWERCGNVYWLAYDTLTTVLSLVQGDQNSNIDGAIHHAEQLPLQAIYAARFRAIQKAMGDPKLRPELAQALIELAQELGRVVQSNQPDFDKRDPWQQGKVVNRPMGE